MSRARACVLAIACVAALGAGAPQQAPPVFRSGTDIVAVDVLVVDKTGQPVTDLAADDFTLLVDGKPRKIRSLDLDRYDNPAAKVPEMSAVPAIRPSARVVASADYSTNSSAPPGRLFVLAIDEGNLTRGGGRGAMKAAAAFIDRLAPNDLVALVSLPVGVTVDFTADRALVRDALMKIVGGGANKYESRTNVSMAEAFALVTGSQRRLWNAALEQECYWARSQSEFDNCQSTLEADAHNKFAAARSAALNSTHSLEVLIRRLGRIEGPKHVVVISEALVTGSSFGFLEGVGDLAWLGDRAQAARVNLYVLHLDTAFLEAFNVAERFPTRTPIEDAHLLEDGLGQMAGLSGGAYFKLITALDPAFDRIIRETSAAYVLTFETEDADRDGKSHSLRLRVARPDVAIRARKQFVVDRSVRPATVADRLTQALNSPFLSAAIPVSVASYVVGDPGGQDLRVLVAAEVGCSAQDPGDFDVGYLVSDAAGRGIGSRVVRADTTVPRVSGEQCVYYTSNFTAKAGDYVLRVAGADGNQRVGGVEHHLGVRLSEAGPLDVSSLVLTDPAVRVDGRMRLLVDGSIGGRTVAAYVEIRMRRQAPGAGNPTAQPGVVFEVVPENGDEPVLRVAPAVTGDPTPGHWFAESPLDLSALPAGAYRARAIVSWDGAVVGQVSRTLAIPPPQTGGTLR